MKTLPGTVVLLACLAVLGSGCSGFFKGKQASEKTVGEIHKLYNEGKLVEIRSQADTRFKNATSEQEWLGLISAVQRKLGKVKSSANRGFNIRTFNLTTSVVLQQNTEFEQGRATETFAFEVRGDKAVLVQYNIASNELVMR